MMAVVKMKLEKTVKRPAMPEMERREPTMRWTRLPAEVESFRVHVRSAREQLGSYLLPHL